MTPIGIVIPTFNGERFLAETLRSVQSQSVGDWECVIVDDGSADGSTAIASQFTSVDERFRLVRQPNAGVSAARNRGFRELSETPRYIVFLDQDDVWLPNTLEALSLELDRHPGAVGAHGLCDTIDESGVRTGEEFTENGRRRLGYDGLALAPRDPALPTAFETLLYANAVCPPGLLLARREFYDRVGPWDVNFAAVQDWDMCIRLSRHGEVRYVDRVVILYRRHARSGSRDGLRNIVEIRRLYHKTFFSPENDERQQKLVRDGWRALQVYRMREKIARAHAEIRSGRLAAGTMMLGHVAVHAIRLVRCYPTARGV